MRKRNPIIHMAMAIVLVIAVGRNADAVIEAVAPLVDLGWRSESPDLSRFPHSTPPDPAESETTESYRVNETTMGLPAVIAPADQAAARATIAQLTVAEPGPTSSYDRDRFGARWSDSVDATWGHNGCDTRNDILARDLTGETFRDGTNDCVVITGTLIDPYTATTIAFRKENASAVQVDHVVPLARAWAMGAARWDDSTRERFANDPLNLLAVDGPANMAKGDGPPAEWLPPSLTVSCAYTLRYAAVSQRYDLPVTAADQEAMTDACS